MTDDESHDRFESRDPRQPAVAADDPDGEAPAVAREAWERILRRRHPGVS